MTHASERLPSDIYKFVNEVATCNGATQDYGGNRTIYDDEVDSLNEYLIPNIQGKVFYDVGAFISIWSVVAAMSGAKEIHMFEVSEGQLNEALLNLKRVNAGIPVYGSRRFVSEIDGARLDDDYGFAGPGFIKIDVEGAELRVLEGAQRLLKENHPILMVENHSSPERDQEILKLAGEGYELISTKEFSNHRHVFLIWKETHA